MIFRWRFGSPAPPDVCACVAKESADPATMPAMGVASLNNWRREMWRGSFDSRSSVSVNRSCVHPFILIARYRFALASRAGEARGGRAPSSQRFGAWWAKHPRRLHVFVAVSLCWSVGYLIWRVGFSSEGSEPVLWAALLLAELYGLWNLATLAWMTWGVELQVPACASSDEQEAWHPDLSVDVYICTYDEPLHVLEATLAGCALLPETHTTYLLDDGRREILGIRHH